jgi:CDP-glucose 4,6-dehydratase
MGFRRCTLEDLVKANLTVTNALQRTYAGKTVLVTGHTGFKGTWLTAWLLKLGARVVGVSNGIPTNPSMFEVLGLETRISHRIADVRDLPRLKEIVAKERPDFVIHLAAQAIVSLSYQDPVETVSTNVIGTMNVLEALRGYDKPCSVVMITSDKCYDNVEWEWGYRETDKMGGKDVYSGSKGAAELVIRCYVDSFFRGEGEKVRIGVGRAGNVIGGGDWAKDRIVADCVRAWSKDEAVKIRSPKATRPWQHVLEPLSGYLALGVALAEAQLHGEAFNFGPRAEQNNTVLDLLHDIAKRWGYTDLEKAVRVTANIPFHEAGLLKLSCDKALLHLKWEPNLIYRETVDFVSDWYIGYYKNKVDMYALTHSQISEYEAIAALRGRVWTAP